MYFRASFNMYMNVNAIVANIHATETTAGVAACYIIQHLVDGYSSNAPIIVQALKTRTFYVVPRVNPDGVEVSKIHHQCWLILHSLFHSYVYIYIYNM